MLAFLPGQASGKTRSTEKLEALYDKQQCFALRDSVNSERAPLFYRAVVACNFRERKPCRKGLRQVIHAAPKSEEAFKALSLRASIELAEGKYHESLKDTESMLRLRPADKDAQSSRTLLLGLAQFPDQKTVHRKASTVAIGQFSGQFYGNLGSPVRIDGRKAIFSFDTGANISAISEAEAARLGLAVRSADEMVTVATGAQVAAKLASADVLQIGGVTLKHVAFLVYPDTDRPYVHFPLGERGTLGIPVLLAIETLRMRDGRNLDLAFRPKALNSALANVCMFGPTVITQMKFGEAVLDFSFDTGANETFLYPAFANSFPNVMASAERRDLFTVNGVGSSAKFATVTLPPLQFNLAGSNVELSPARVLMQKTLSNSSYIMGNLGTDLLGQAKQWAIDFRSMRLSMR
ncbi:MAG: retropepsin-like aspartic protease [Silvibacterium sp.]